LFIHLRETIVNSIDNWFRIQVFRRLDHVEEGQLLIHDKYGTYSFGNPSRFKAEITVSKLSFYKTLVLRGHLGATEAFAKGYWNSPDLTKVVQILLKNRHLVDGMETGIVRLLNSIRSLLNKFRKNSQKGSQRNIAFHYDLGDELFQKFLDTTLSYSCAYFESEAATLEEASIAKYDRICKHLCIKPGDRVIEIGSGWGGFAIHATKNYGCHVTTTTISKNQYAYVHDAIKAEGLEDEIKLLFCDYRNLKGKFDRLVSIEMIEAIGHSQFQIFFNKCSSLLTEQGMAAIQTITIQNRYYEKARREIDFIKTYIFPGSCIPSISALFDAMTHTDLRLINTMNIGPHYAKTLMLWRKEFVRNEEEISKLGYDKFFRRIWEMYFSYCEGGFLEGVLGDHQLILAKPLAALKIQNSTDQVR